MIAEGDIPARWLTTPPRDEDEMMERIVAIAFRRVPAKESDGRAGDQEEAMLRHVVPAVADQSPPT